MFQHAKISYHVNGELLYTDTSQFGSFINAEKVSFCSEVERSAHVQHTQMTCSHVLMLTNYLRREKLIV